MRLPTLLSPQHHACWLLWDDPYGLAQTLGIDLHDPAEQVRLRRFVSFALKVLSPHATGIIADPGFVLPELSAKAKKLGAALRWDKISETVDPIGLPTSDNDWDVEAIRNNYAVAKVGWWYHPAEAAALEKKQLLAELADTCRYEGVDLIVELHVYQPPLSVETEAVDVIEAILQAIQELRALPQAFILEPFADALSAATVTAELDIPWVVALQQPDYSAAKEVARTSLDNGAKGVAIGEGLWADLSQQVDLHDEQAVFEWIATEARDRLIELRRIVDEHSMSVV